MRSRLLALLLPCAFALMQTLVVVHSFEHLTPTKSQVTEPKDSSLTHSCSLCFATNGLLYAFPLTNTLSISESDKILPAAASSDPFLFRSHLLGYLSRAPPLFV